MRVWRALPSQERQEMLCLVEYAWPNDVTDDIYITYVLANSPREPTPHALSEGVIPTRQMTDVPGKRVWGRRAQHAFA